MMTTQRFDTTADNTVFALRRTSARRIAADCLEAGETFLQESAYWDGAQLATWLLGLYSQVAQDVNGSAPSSRPQLRDVTSESVVDLIDDARAEVEDALDRLYDPAASTDVVFAMIDAGYVASTVDPNGASGWVPTTNAIRLADRVLSLFVAAFLARVFDAPCADAMLLAA